MGTSNWEWSEWGARGERSHQPGAHRVAATGTIFATSWSRWKWPISTSGVYAFEVYIPPRSQPRPFYDKASRAARYEILGGTSLVARRTVVDQYEHEGDSGEGIRGRLVPVGYEEFYAGATAVLSLGNAAFVGSEGSGGMYLERSECNLSIYSDKARLIKVCNWSDVPGSTSSTPGATKTPAVPTATPAT